LIAAMAIFLFFGYRLIAQASPAIFRKADSLYFASDWANSKSAYEQIIKDTSHDAMHLNRLGFANQNLGNYPGAENYYHRALLSNPISPEKVSVLSRMARVKSLLNKPDEAFMRLDSAIAAGYSNLSELDTSKDFNNIRNDSRFKKVREQVYGITNPCMVNPQAREFDFWIGEWDVYPTGAKNIVGNSVVQMSSSGCALLENWTSPLSNGKSLNFVDPITNKWKQVWVGSYANGIQDFINGEYKEGAMHFTFETRDAQGHKVIGRFIFYNQGANQVRQFNETSIDDGKTWVTSYDFTYIRKK
ncbi:MAG: tetratricopeptide repeat protein, partial [Ginsengibacter sp.]